MARLRCSERATSTTATGIGKRRQHAKVNCRVTMPVCDPARSATAPCGAPRGSGASIDIIGSERLFATTRGRRRGSANQAPVTGQFDAHHCKTSQFFSYCNPARGGSRATLQLSTVGRAGPPLAPYRRPAGTMTSNAMEASLDHRWKWPFESGHCEAPAKTGDRRRHICGRRSQRLCATAIRSRCE